MQSDLRFLREKEVPHFTNEWGNNYTSIPVASSFGVEFQSCEVCLKNFIIFDQTDHHSQIMFHPAVAHKFVRPALNIHANFETKGEGETSSFGEEDSDDIDALLSMEEEEEEDEEVSTARSHGCYGNKLHWKNGCSSSEGKRQRMKKMVKVLRKTVPGGDQMNTANVLDEAVKYLKSLKVEVQNLDVGHLTTKLGPRF